MINFCLDNYICMLKWNLFQVMQKLCFRSASAGPARPPACLTQSGRGSGMVKR
jgi:hypothetical protein